MKKVMLLVVTVMLISAFLMASGPSLRIVRLTVINKSGNEVMIKLEGSDLGKQFYYLTIPAGNKDWPTVEVFTVLEDIYKRTTWYGEGDVPECVGVSNTGWLVMDRNNRLTFTPCYSVPMRTIESYDPVTNKMVYTRVTNAGEPSQEKVLYYEYAYVLSGNRTWLTWDDFDVEILARGCGYSWLQVKDTSKKVPDLCQWRYQYGGLDG